MACPSRELFTRIAGGYDTLNRVLSCGTDILWRRWALDALEATLGGEAPAAVLDLATGTADFAIAAAKRFPAAQVTGLDATPAMLEGGRRKIERERLADRVNLVEGDAEALAFPARTFDVAMCAFGFRNFPHPETALSALATVLKPRGKLLILELFRNESRLLAWFTSTWLRVVAWLFAHSHLGAYAYLRTSIETTRSADEFIDLAKEAGFQLRKKSFYLPSCTCLCFELDDVRN